MPARVRWAGPRARCGDDGYWAQTMSPSTAAPRRHRGRSALHGLSTALIVAGSLLLLDAGATLLWEEPLSSVYAHREQSALGGELDRLETFKPPPVEVKAMKALPDPKRKLAFAARSLDRRTDGGDAVGRLRIERIGLS